MSYQLLALDLDGTTLQDDHQLNPAIIEVVQRVKHHYPVLIVTGRHHTAAEPYYHQLGLTTPIICCNGTYCYDYQQDRVVQHNAIPRAHAEQFLALAEQYQLQMVMYTRDAMTFAAHDPISYMLPLQAWAQHYPIGQQPNIYQIDDFTAELAASEYIWKFVVEGCESAIEQFLALPFIRDNFTGAWSGQHRIDLAAKGNCKGDALRDYVQSIGIDIQQVVVAGDNFNDISMLSVAGVGIAMQHAQAEVKASANVVCEDDNHGGSLALLIEQYFPVNDGEE